MPFATIEQIQPFIEESLYEKLKDNAESGKTFFEEVEAQAATFVNKEIGLEIPSDVSDAPDYIPYPYAKIIQKFAMDLIDDVRGSEQTPRTDKINQEFAEAVEFLKKQSTTDKSEGEIGEINGIEVW